MKSNLSFFLKGLLLILGHEDFLLFPSFFLNFLLLIFDRDRAQVGEGQREKETQNPKQALGSELSAQSPMRGLNPQTEIMT